MIALLAVLCGRGAAESNSGVAFSRTSQAVAFTQNMEVGDYKSLSFQVDYASAIPAGLSIAGGSVSSVTFQVADYAGLHGQASSATVTLVSGHNQANIASSYIAINGQRFTEGVDWNKNTNYATMTAYNLGVALNAYGNFYATTSSNVVTVTARSTGTAQNSWTITSSTAAFGVSAFSTGQDYGYLSINGVTLTEGTSWNAATSSDTTAANIVTAINGNSSLSAIVLASTGSAQGKGFLQVVSLATGLNAYPLTTSNTTKLSPSFYQFAGGVAPDFSIATDVFTKAAHGLSTGMSVVFSTGSNKTVGGLTHGTTYYAIPINANTFKLASSAANAIAGTAIDLTSVQDGATHALTPSIFSVGSAGFDWRGSNDGSTFYALPIGTALSSVTYSTPNGQLFTFTDYAYKYLQLSFTGPTRGGITVTATINGRK